MPFTATPLIGGDTYEMALRLALDADAELSALAEPGEHLAALRRHWDAIAGLGWMATMVAEDAGGAGGELGDVAALACGAGRGGLPLPLAMCCAVAPSLLAAAGARDALARLAEGTARICVILPDATQDPGAPPLRCGATLEGGVVAVETPPDPTHLLLATAGGDVLLLPATAPGITRALSLRIDGRLAADWHFTGAEAHVLARGLAPQIDQARDLGALITCVEGVSAMGAIIEQTIAFLSDRVQFNAPLASYQALRHRVAEMYVEYENLRGLVAHALRGAASADALPWRDIALAKLRLGEAGRLVAHETIQMHGGMGLTEGVRAIRLARRVMMAEFEFGDRSFQAGRLLAQAA
ncbi:acyl-CoA dehydrogenase family protein [Falsiroseomonas sp. E2-1-a4]|uniref:acyl-CoA dehydrogenase family protein n=1 Tax=Falsiroseomonas sp. E2-1-a4 TaxID=3239299 RepID=UPI003F40C8EF